MNITIKNEPRISCIVYELKNLEVDYSLVSGFSNFDNATFLSLLPLALLSQKSESHEFIQPAMLKSCRKL